jgi:CBS domain-containing protein
MFEYFELWKIMTLIKENGAMKTNEEISILEQLKVWSIAPDLSNDDALQGIADTGVGALLVLEAGRLVGLLSSGDSYSRLALTGKSFDEEMLRGILIQNGIGVSYDQIVEKCLALTQKYNVRHLPVLVDGYLIGIVSMEDLGNVILSDV